jgi:gluconate 2-dehydrogenase gamma chain
MDALHSRRSFLRAAAAAGVAWATADLVEVDAALAWARQHATSGEMATGAGALTKLEFETIDALSSRILPAVDGRPGAHEAGAVYFIDRALATFNAKQKKVYEKGVADLNHRAGKKSKGAAIFTALAPAAQDEVIREIETSRFFQAVRFDTIVGTFALPTWGGNRDFAGWQLLGLNHQPSFQPPFGYYDAEANRSSGS